MADTTDQKPEPPTTLGVFVDTAEITAALLHADGTLEPVRLGSTELPAAAAVAQSPDGAVLVGESALRSSGPIATDPMERARSGRVGALTAVLAHVIGRASASAGSTPRRLALVVPDDWNREERDRLVHTGTTAGIADVVLVPETAARAEQPDVDAIVGMAAAAALLSRSADVPPPIVTREDLGGASGGPVVRPPARRPESPKGPRSVFDDEVAPAPAAEPRPGAASGISSSAEPTQVLPQVPQSQQVSHGPPPRPSSSPMERPDRRAPVGLLIAVVIVLVAGAAIGAIALAGGDDSAAPVATTASRVAVDTTAAPVATTSSTSTTSSTTSSTSTTTSSTSTTSTTTTPTTTIPLPVGVPGKVTLVETGLQLDTGEVLTFEQSDTVVIAALTAALGSFDLDSAWYVTTFCLGARTRILTWGDLEIVFTEDVLDSGLGKFTQWHVSGIDSPVGLVTIDGLGFGATVGFLEVTYGTAVTIAEAIPGDPSGLFAVTNPASGGVLLGVTTTRDPDGVITSMWAGDSCTRIYT